MRRLPLLFHAVLVGVLSSSCTKSNQTPTSEGPKSFQSREISKSISFPKAIEVSPCRWDIAGANGTLKLSLEQPIIGATLQSYQKLYLVTQFPEARQVMLMFHKPTIEAVAFLNKEQTGRFGTVLTKDSFSDDFYVGVSVSNTDSFLDAENGAQTTPVAQDIFDLSEFPKIAEALKSKCKPEMKQ